MEKTIQVKISLDKEASFETKDKQDITEDVFDAMAEATIEAVKETLDFDNEEFVNSVFQNYSQTLPSNFESFKKLGLKIKVEDKKSSPNQKLKKEAHKQAKREIKFRVWDKKNKEMFYEKNNSKKLSGHISKDLKPFCLNKDGFLCKLMQFTGLKDKNGKEIYEGDILFKGGYKKTEVKWNGILCQFTFGFDLKKVYASEIEVIGNKFENPELLEEKNE